MIQTNWAFHMYLVVKGNLDNFGHFSFFWEQTRIYENTFPIILLLHYTDKS